MSKWFSPRALALHLSLVLWVGLCVFAAWWQVGRAVEGNSLSYFYAIEWPVFGVLGVLGWYALLTMEKVTADEQDERRAYEERMRATAREARAASVLVEDPTLAAYNDHLADLATQPKKRIWGH